MYQPAAVAPPTLGAGGSLSRLFRRCARFAQFVVYRHTVPLRELCCTQPAAQIADHLPGLRQPELLATRSGLTRIWRIDCIQLGSQMPKSQYQL